MYYKGEIGVPLTSRGTVSQVPPQEANRGVSFLADLGNVVAPLQVLGEEDA